MVKKLLKTNVKPGSVRLILLGLAFMILINLLAIFEVFDWTTAYSSVLTIVGALFIMIEVSIYSMLKRVRKGKINVADLIIGLVGLFAIVGATLNLVAVEIPVISAFLTSAEGFINIALLVAVFVEIFRRN